MHMRKMSLLLLVSIILLLPGTSTSRLCDSPVLASARGRATPAPSPAQGHSIGANLDGQVIPVSTSQDFREALKSAQPGDTILLAAGEVFTGNFTLPNKGGSDWITIRSSALSELPASGVRVGPSHAAMMPKVISPNSGPALATVAGAHHYRIEGVEFGIAPKVMINYGIVRLGDSGGGQDSIEKVPHHLVIDRCYIHGHPTADVSRAIALNSGETSIVNSYISECHGIGFDTQAIGGWAGPGPFEIINNYLEGSGENLMFGGADPKIPNLVPSDITIRRNHFAKPISWKEGILLRPRELTISESGGVIGGLVSGLTYYYRVAGRGRAGYNTMATSAASDEIAISLGTGLSAVNINWSPVAFATEYRVYRTSDGPEVPTRRWVYYVVSTSTFTDVGDTATAQAGSEPPKAGTRWTVKNLLELKNARRVIIEGNVFENNWVDAQTGYAILFKSSNQGGKAPWAITEQVTFRNNIVRNASAGINILGKAPHFPSEKTREINIENNLFVNIDKAIWGGDGHFLKITDSTNITVSHNTVFNTGSIIAAYGEACQGFRFTDNLVSHNTYGIKGDGAASGNATLQKYFPGIYFRKNVIAGANRSNYPIKKNFYPSTLEEVRFVEMASGDYRLAASSPYKRKGTRRTDIGADIDKIDASTRGVVIPPSEGQ